MRLKRVRIFGFKTFADRTEFSLDGGVIAVVGPNGCGKSNLVDAILWGLGEGNARMLRAQHSQDVIFSGSARRKPVGFAEVSLLFDNEDGSLPIETPEVSISRRLTRSGDSEYRINNRVCRLRDIYDLLADSGLGRAGYAIIGQKEIDSALSASAEDRRAWVDEAAGVQRYRARKLESKRRIAQANEHLERVGDILRELEDQREPLRQEAEQAQRFKTLQAALREVEIGLLVEEVAKAAQELKEMEQRIDDATRLATEELAKASELEAKGRHVGQKVSEMEQEIDSIRGLQQGSLTALERADAQLKLLHQRLQNLDDQEKGLSEDGEGVAQRIRESEAEVAGLIEEEKTEREAFEALQAELAGVGEEAQRLTAALKQAESALEEARRQHTLRLKAEAEKALQEERKSQAIRELKGIEATIPELDEAINEAQAAYDTLALSGQNRQGEIKSLEGRIHELRQEEERDAQSVRKSMAEKASLEGRKRGIEATIDAHEGLNQGARAVMDATERGILTGEYVPVGEAVEADKDVALAIETALGGSANDLICDDPSDAKRAIEWLKAHRAGRATFQPIPLMRPSEVTHDLRQVLNERGVVGRASELVSCRNKHRPVIDSLLGRVVIVEDIDDALRLARTRGWGRLVTLDGEVVHSSGAVTGGQQSRTGYGLVQRKADLGELADQISKLDRIVREFDLRSAERAKARHEAEASIREIREASAASQGEINEARNFLQTLIDEKKSTERQKEKLLKELADLDGSHADLPEVDLAAAEQLRDDALRALAGKSADAEQAESRLREAESRVSQSQSRLIGGQRRLQASRDAELQRLRRLENLAPDRERFLAERESAEKSREEATRNKAEADARLEAAQALRREMLEESLRLSEEARNAREHATKVSESAHQAEVSRTRAEARRSTALQRLFEEYSMSEEDAKAEEGKHEVPADANGVVTRFRRELRAMGDVNLGAIEAYERLSGRFEELSAQSQDISEGIDQIESSIKELDKLTKDRFMTTFSALEVEFTSQFQKLFGGGEGKIELSDPQNVLESGVDLLITLPGKKRQPLQLLSGGERSLSTMAFLFSLLKVKPSPLVVLDEVDAPLDGRNVERFASALQDLTDRTQFIVITHNPSTIETAPVWLGVSMQEPGVSMLVPAQLPEKKKELADASEVPGIVLESSAP